MLKSSYFKLCIFLAIFCLLFLANACRTSRKKPKPKKQSIAMVSQYDSTQYYAYHIIYPDSVKPPAVATTMKRYAHQNKQMFMKMQPTDTSIYGHASYELRVEFKKVFQSPRFISYVGNAYQYTGGAHGRSSVKTLTYDLKTGLFVTIDSLFDDTTALQPISQYAKQAIISKIYKQASEPNLTSYDKKWVLKGTAPLIKNFAHF